VCVPKGPANEHKSSNENEEDNEAQLENLSSNDLLLLAIPTRKTQPKHKAKILSTGSINQKGHPLHNSKD
jgi:hypothetical protein